MSRGGANRKPTAARRRYFELLHQGLKGAAGARQVGVSTSCGSKWFIEAGSVIIPDIPVSSRFLTQDDRIAIAIADGLRAGKPPAAIAAAIGKSRPTVHREMNRDGKDDGSYDPWNSSHLVGSVGRRSWWGSLSSWFRMSCGSCFNGWCRKCPRGLRVVDGAVMVMVRCWPRSCSWPRRVTRGSSCPQLRSGRPAQRLIGVFPSERRPGCGPSSTAWPTGPPPMDRRTHHGLARRLPPSPPTPRTQSRALSRRHEHRLHPHLLPQAHQLR